jgi:ribosome-associated toxin RatA of RatAB toxin-antitoxin module
MRNVKRFALVPHTAEEMFCLVDDVESYPSFLPWCNDASVHRRTAKSVEATLELHKGSLSRHFTTRNTLRRPERIELALVGGPFRHLSGGWGFDELGADGCKVSLELDFEFDSRLVDMMFGSFFEETCNSLVDAFTRRAQVVYGRS